MVEICRIYQGFQLLSYTDTFGIVFDPRLNWAILADRMYFKSTVYYSIVQYSTVQYIHVSVLVAKKDCN